MNQENVAVEALQPNQTLYVRNLNDKVKPEELKQELFLLFATYGEILEINIKKSYKMKGQAFVVFKDIIQSTEAIRALQNFRFLGRELSIHFARSKSDIIAKKEGTFNPLSKKRAKQRGMTEEEVKKKEKKEEVSEALVNNVLMVMELPKEVTTEMLEALFSQYPGYIRAQLIPDKSLAFIEYDTEEQATTALKGLKGFYITPEQPLKVDYAQ